MTKGKKKLHKHISSQSRLTLAVLISVAILLGANLLVSNILATSGEKLRSLETRKENLMRQNNKIRQVVLESMALDNLESKARELGFVKSSKTLNIASRERVAMHRNE